MIYFTDKKKMRRSLMATLLIGETILCFLIPLSLVVWLVINTIQNVNLDPNLIIKEVEHLADLISQRTGYNLLQKENLRSVVSTIPYIGQSLMGNITSFTINLFVLVFVLYFMLIGGRKMETYIYEILPFNECHWNTFSRYHSRNRSHDRILFHRCPQSRFLRRTHLFCHHNTYIRDCFDMVSSRYIPYDRSSLGKRHDTGRFCTDSHNERR